MLRLLEKKREEAFGYRSMWIFTAMTQEFITSKHGSQSQ